MKRLSEQDVTDCLSLACLLSAAEVDDSQDSSIMTDADDTQLHTAESDDVL